MVRQIVGTIIGTLLFCIVALGILDYAGVVKVFDIKKLSQSISQTLPWWSSWAINLDQGIVPSDDGACPVGMVAVLTGQNMLVCQDAPTIGHDCIGLDGKVVLYGASVTGYKSNYQTCDAIPRVCENGVLSGDPSYALTSCQTYVSGSQDCNLSGDLVVAEHNTILRRSAEKTDKDGSCSYIKMVCNQGILEWIESFVKDSCQFKQSVSASYLLSHPEHKGLSGETVWLEYISMPGAQPCTTPRWTTVQDGNSVFSFENDRVWHRQQCVYNLSYCKNGVLDDNILKYWSCEVQEPAWCDTPWKTTIKHGQSVTWYRMTAQQNGPTTCESQTRLCIDGSLSGSYELSACPNTTSKSPVVTKPKFLPVGQCKTPRWTWIDNGKVVTAYQSYNVAYDQFCESETRTCRDGLLDGTFTAKTCTVWQVKACTTPWGTAVKHGETVFAYADKTVGYGSVCASETRYCNDGILDGSFQYANCSVGKPIECPLPRWGTIPHGQSVFAYQKTQVSYGQTCSSIAEQRRCTNGVLWWSYMFEGCEVEPGADCATNRWTVKHGQTIARYQSPQVYGQVADGSDQCVRFTLKCSNGEVVGSLLEHPEAVYKSCTVVFPDDTN